MRSIERRYQDAEQLLHWNLEPKLKNRSVIPHWLDGHRFWFKQESQRGYEFFLVDSDCLTKTPAFDHQRLAANLSEQLIVTLDPRKLPIESIQYHAENHLRLIVRFSNGHRNSVLLELDSYHCTLEKVDENFMSVLSPDGRREVVSREHNLVLRDRKTGVEKVLTKDGERHYGYGTYGDFLKISICEGAPLLPAVLWSPDGRLLAVQRIDQRQVKDMPFVQSVPEDGSVRPIEHNYKIALPGDLDIPLASLCVIDIERNTIVTCDRPAVPASDGGFFECGSITWGTNNRVYYTEWTRDKESIRFVEFDPETATCRVLVEDNGQGYLHPGPLPFEPAVIKVLDLTNEFIWYSERNGWGHLYRYNLATGELINPITSGDYVVTAIHLVDIDHGCLYFSACGREPDRNPYYEHLYRVKLDGSELVLLTPEASQHDIIVSGMISEDFKPLVNVHGFSPDGKVFVETISRIDQAPNSVLRSAVDGAELMNISKSDMSLLTDTPYVPPASFTVKATDNSTDLWGVIHKPSDFDDSQRYPVILALYGGPQRCIVPKRFAEFEKYVGKVARTLAELGFIVVTVDPRGTPLRSKSFHAVAYGNMQNGGGIEDQICALKQLAEHYPWMDMSRVGITGHSAGGYASARALLSHPDFFKVAVSSAGNHDLNLTIAGWGEAFQGLLKSDNYKAQANISLAQNLRGKLLLVQGDMDANVHIANTLQLVNKLIDHNRDFDLLLLPNRRHGYIQDPFFIRRVWDYFIVHLLQENPPENYHITGPEAL